MLWSEKYAPQNLNEIVGHNETCRKVAEWAGAWQKGQKCRPLLLTGGVGAGKTSIATALAREFDFELLEMNASDVRNEKNIERIAGIASVSRTFSGKQRLILLDEIDGLLGREDHGGAGAVARILDSAACPIILTANDAYDKKLAAIRQKCELLQLRALSHLSTAKLLRKIAEKEGIKISEDAVESIAKKSRGDVRAAINDFQQVSTGRAEVTAENLSVLSGRDRKEGIFDVVRTIFKTHDFQASRETASNLDEEPDFLMKWIDENIPKEYKEPQDIFEAYERLSRADIFLGRIHRNQNYGFTRYASDLMSSGVSLAKSKKYSGFTRYQFPSAIRFFASTKSERGMMKSIGRKVGKVCHVSVSTAVRDYLPMLSQLVKKSAGDIESGFGLAEEEMEYLKK